MEMLTLFFFGCFFLFFDLYGSLFFFSIFYAILSLFGGGPWFGGVFFSDDLSFFLVFLSSLIFLFCLFSSLVDMWFRNLFGVFYFYLFSIFLFLFLSFVTFSQMFFYMSFEFIFVLMFLFLLGWGYSPERLMASFYMVFYTLVVSFPFLVFLAFSGGFAPKFFLVGNFGGYWWLFFVLVFLVKLPVYGVHLWLPKAHVEAPVSGSMVLAGVLLKLGGYGMIRFSPFFLESLCSLRGIFLSLGVFGGLLSCLLCLRQSDLKAFVAYSSVCHMGFGLGGLYAGGALGYSGSIFMMISHGFCSSCLFYILYVLYERFFTRSSLILKGVGYIFPLMLLVWFSFSALNMGVPPSFSFFSEVLIFSGLMGVSFGTLVLSFFLLLLSGFYGIFFYVVSCHSLPLLGGWSSFLTFREYLLFWGHFYFLFFSIFSLGYFFF